MVAGKCAWWMVDCGLQRGRLQLASKIGWQRSGRRVADCVALAFCVSNLTPLSMAPWVFLFGLTMSCVLMWGAGPETPHDTLHDTATVQSHLQSLQPELEKMAFPFQPPCGLPPVLPIARA
ncbi:hypothetical protein mRhiFer1_010272 [Rhinolophus ferrumequinum]|uniref:Uncharacterized protein n=1 Tax=Rhinolophus ferrumequinum TaxID=59479 RepID=A0A7J7X5F0_RHIFE|nr:hypothetical protein mRhiFer1_010272 [Rhinolophus ferrumequinum]